jgi:hypothetical protein
MELREYKKLNLKKLKTQLRKDIQWAKSNKFIEFYEFHYSFLKIYIELFKNPLHWFNYVFPHIIETKYNGKKHTIIVWYVDKGTKRKFKKLLKENNLIN